jgi:hypothetical protein
VRTWTPVVLAAGPGVISTVAGSNGTLVSTEPRVAIAAAGGQGLAGGEGVVPG